MAKYGFASKLAAQLAAEQKGITPPDAWQKAVELVFPDSASSRAKACPRDAFLGLCESGAVIGIPPGSYTKSTKNKTYVARALAALRRDARLSANKRHLWRIATENEEKKENSQMDVLISLWQAGMIH